jgi:hypothetical protein
MTPTETLFLTFAVTVIGSGLGTTIVGALFKARFDEQLDTHRALLERSGKIHERQVDALLAIHSKLEFALFSLQRAASAGKYTGGEASDRELLERMAKDLGAASEEFSRNKLLFGETLRRRLDEFFQKTLVAGMSLGYAMSYDIPDGETRVKFWDKARELSDRELPSILEAIRNEARTVIHN